MNQRRFFGVIVLIVGTLFLLNALNIGVNVWSVIGDYWPVIIIAVGALNIYGSSGARLPGIIVIGVGVILLLKTTGVFVITINLWQFFLPVIIILVGVSLLMPKGNGGLSDDDFIRQFAIFSGPEIASNSLEFRGANLTALFGGIDLDIREVELTEEKQVKIDVFAAFGGVDIIVPEDMTVSVTGIPLFGGWGSKARKPMRGELADIKINALVLFGGMDIRIKK